MRMKMRGTYDIEQVMSYKIALNEWTDALLVIALTRDTNHLSL